MGFIAMAMLAFMVATCFMSTAESTPCPLGTVVMNITSTIDVQHVTDALACVGQGNFNITWHSSVVINERIEVSDGKHLTITADALGDENAAGVTIDAGRGFGIFSVSSGSTLRLNNITLEGGNAEDGGAIAVLSSSALFVFGCIFTRNSASNGGALFASTSSIYVDGSTLFENNTALYGGAISAFSSAVGIAGNATFTSNSADVGGAKGHASFIACSALGAIYASDSDLDIDGNAMFTHNWASSRGGAVYASSSELGIDGSAMFTRNSARGFGGAVYASSSELGVDGNAMFTYNSADWNGGAVYADLDSNITIGGNAMFTKNSASQEGGAVHALSSEFSIDGNAWFTNNSASTSGGAIKAFSSGLTIDGSATFTSNSADFGGAVYTTAGSKTSVGGNAMFTNNSALEDGGAVFVLTSEFGINGNGWFYNNSVLGDGGAVYARNSELSIDGNATFTHNSADLDGGALCTSVSELGIDGNTKFTHNTAGLDGGAILLFSSNVTVSSSKTRRGGMSGYEGGLYSDESDHYTSDGSVVFVNNSADGLGGAISFQACDEVLVGNTMFKSNQASFGGAVYVVDVDDKPTIFSRCMFEGNTAEDGGALYLNTGPGVDIFIDSVFRDNFAWTSGGAIFHTGSMRVSNTSFVANKVVVEGPAVMSVGFLDVMYNVNFSQNAYYCPVGEYGYIENNETHFCSSCFKEVCSRCVTVGDAISVRKEVRIDGKPVCAVPPVGATAPLPGTTIASLTLQKGYFRTSNESHDILKCYQKVACHGGNDADDYCTSGYTGPYCAVCTNDFAPGIAYSCRECSGDIKRSAVGLAVAVGLVVLLLSGALLSYLGTVPHDGAEKGIEMEQNTWENKFSSCWAFAVNKLPVRAIKITVTVWQIISQFEAIAGDVYPELYQTFVSKISPINLDLDFIFSYSCLISNNFYDHLVVATITPLLALVVLAASYFIGTKRNSGSESAIREVQHKHQAVILFIAFLVYSPVSYRIFQTFGCDQLDDGETYLRVDYSLSCLTARHNWYKVYASTMVAVYPIGIAAGFAGLLAWHRRDLVKPDRGMMLHLKPFNGVWAAYKPSRYYYEVVECGRRTALTIIAAFVLPNSKAQISMALLFAVAYVFVSEVLSPFQKGIDTGLYRWGNGIIVASMYVAFLKRIDVGQDSASAGYLLTFSGVLIAANIFMVVTVLVQTVLMAKEMCAMRNAVRVVEIPVRRTHSAVGNIRPVDEGGVCRDGGEALESKDCEI